MQHKSYIEQYREYKNFNHLVEGFTEDDEFFLGCTHKQFLQHLNNNGDELHTHEVPRTLEIVSTCEKPKGICDYRAFKLVPVR